MITPPVPVGFSFPVHPQHLTKPCHNLGGYTIIEDSEQGIIISGYRELNLFAASVTEVRIIPMDTNYVLDVLRPTIEEADRNTSIYWTFDYEPNQIIYYVTYADGTWVFYDKHAAISLLNLIVDVKRHGIQEHLNTLVTSDTESGEDACQSAPTE